MKKIKSIILGFVLITVLLGCTKEISKPELIVEPSIKEVDEVINIEEAEKEVFETMDSSMKVETCTISAKAIETIDHHGNHLLIMRKEDEEYLDPSKGFYIFEISNEIKEKIIGTSWHEGAKVNIENLRYVQVIFKGIDSNNHIGGLIVHSEVAEDVIEIFKELYDANYPFEKIRPIHYYGGDDNLSMADNNTSSFNYRVVEGTNNLSKHSYGIAIDLNPVQNPFVTEDNVSPELGVDYLDRNKPQAGMVIEGDVCHKAFISRGWKWGGSWNTIKDYQHFQKIIDVDKLILD